MKKLLLILTMLVMMLPSMCFADPVIKSDSRTFNPLTGVYDLQGNVFVQFPAHDTTLTITGDATKVYLYAMEVHGQGNIRLSFGDMSFACDKVDVYHSGRTAYVNGNLVFNDNSNKITADSGSYCWKTKIAAFHGNVTVNGQPHDGRAPDYDDWDLNGDLLFWNEPLQCSYELSSMGIRVSPESMDRQLTAAGCDDRRELPFHKAVLNGELPYTIGGGIGQSRLCMLLLGSAHIGEVQASVWDNATREACEKAGIPLL